MDDLKDKLLEKALESILHGSTQIVSRVNSSGQEEFQEVRINDLRLNLIERIAQLLVNTPKYQEILVKAFTDDVIKKIQENAIAKVSFSDLPYRIKEDFERQMRDSKIEVKKYKLVAETIEEPK